MNNLLLLQCDFCDRSFKTQLLLQRHVACKHDETKEHLCDICNSTFKARGSLNRHFRQTHQRIG